MTAKPRPDVTIYPTGDAWISDVPAVEQTVSAERADELLAYSPAAFTTKKPKGARQSAADKAAAETTDVPSTPETPSADAGDTTQEVPA